MTRRHYRTVFPEEEFAPLAESEDGKGKKDSSKIYKINYSINMMPMIGTFIDKQHNLYTGETTKEVANGDINVLGVCTESDELDMFSCQPVQELIEFKWNQYGWALHFFGFCVHISYIVILFIYTNVIYIEGKGKGSLP